MIRINCALLVLVAMIILAVMIVMPIIMMGYSFYVYISMAVLTWIASILIWNYCLVNKYNNIWLYLMTFAILYAAIVASNYLFGFFLNYKMNQFDLDGDTIFSIAEQTSEQQKYMKIYINDLNRNLSFITGAFCSFLNTIVLFVVVKIYSALSSRSEH